MDFISEGLIKAAQLIFSLDKEVAEVVFLTLRVSMISVFLASLLGLPLGFLLATRDFKGKRFLESLVGTLMALPTVVVGLLLYSFLSRRGPLGFLSLLFTPWAIIGGQFILATPLITGMCASAFKGVDKRIWSTALSLGASPLHASLTLFQEARFAILMALMAGFGRVIAEVGSALILGGNIKGSTRVLTTAIALETSKGDFGLALALGFILLSLALTVNLLSNLLSRQT